MVSDELIERWWTPAGRALAGEVFRFLRGERALPDDVDFLGGYADLRGIGISPPLDARAGEGSREEQLRTRWRNGSPIVDYGPVGGPRFVVTGCHWRNLDLRSSWLQRMEAVHLHVTECLFDHANLRGWRLRGCQFADSSFAGADLTRGWPMTTQAARPEAGQGGSVDELTTTFAGCIFDDARMNDLDLWGGHLLGCTFERTRLDRTRFRQVELRNCVFSGSLRDVVFDARRTTDGPSAPPMIAVDFTDADLDGTEFLGCRFRRVQLPPGLAEVEEYPAVIADADRRLAPLDSREAESLRGLLRPVLDDDRHGNLEPDSVGVFDRLRYQAIGGDPLAALAETYILTSTKQSRARRVEVSAPGAAGTDPNVSTSGTGGTGGTGGNVAAQLIGAGEWQPPGLAAANEIDLIAKSPEGEATLFIVETRPWGTEADQRDQLARKVTTYCEYLLEGRLEKDYPGLAGRPVVLRLECATQPPPPIQNLIRLIARHLVLQDISFVVDVDPSLTEPPEPPEPPEQITGTEGTD